VTFSIAQMEAIEEAIERRLRDQSAYEHFFKEDRLEGFFVKNLENVQGDERDVIIFSMGYGRDQKGHMTLNFGPLNKAGGERRLNVAVTRAREKLVLVTSIKASDINITPSSPAGVLALRGYLEYAERSCEKQEPAQQTQKPDSPLEESVAAEIHRMDYSVSPKVGCSAYPIDIAVVDPANPGCYLLGIECDGATYRASTSARDRDRLRGQVLKQLGWSIHRIWSPDWVSRRDSEIRRLKDAIEQACQQQTESTLTLPEEPEDKQDYTPQKIETKQTHFGGTERIGIPYKVHTLKATFNPYVTVHIPKYPYSSVQKNEFHFPENRVLQSRLLEELVREEGPIHFEYAVQRLAAAWRVKRTTPKVTQAAKEALNLLVRDHRLTIKSEFLWPNNLAEVQLRVPDPGIPDSTRPPSHIPPEEIENALKLIVQYALSISAESLITETTKLFGFSHAGEKTKRRFQETLEKMVRERKLILTNGIVTVP
jgi:very-short-patch-repair endonuclease